jgi:hypothetical protein
MSRLPPWRVADLPAPPPFTLRNVLAVIGPGTIALSMSIAEPSMESPIAG